METLIKEFNNISEKDLFKVVDFLYSYLNKEKIQVVLLEADLGAGKTRLVQELAKVNLKIKENVNSPTFNLMKIYNIKNKEFFAKTLIHIDAYRLNNYSDLQMIGLEDFLLDQKNLLFIEWPKNLDHYLQRMKFPYLKIKITINEDFSRNFQIYKN